MNASLTLSVKLSICLTVPLYLPHPTLSHSLTHALTLTHPVHLCRILKPHRFRAEQEGIAYLESHHWLPLTQF